MKIAKPSYINENINPNIHPTSSIFLVVVDVFTRVGILRSKLKILTIPDPMPIMIMYIFTDVGHSKGKNSITQTMFPGEFVYRCAHANLINRITKVIIIPIEGYMIAN